MQLLWLLPLFNSLFRSRICAPGIICSSCFITGIIATVDVILGWLGIFYHFSNSYFPNPSLPCFSNALIRTSFSVPLALICVRRTTYFPPHFHAHSPASTVGTAPARAYSTVPTGPARTTIIFHAALRYTQP